MNTRSVWLRNSLLLVMILGLVGVPEAMARTAAGGRRSGGGSRACAPKMSAPRRPSRTPSSKAVRMPRVASPSRGNATKSTSVKARTGSSTNRTNKAATAATSAGTTTGAISPNTYTYGTGTSARHYRARGYGRGYSNRSYGRSGYGNSQGNTRAVVSRLRSVHSSLARIDHDYQGHRVKAMHSVSMAIRQLSHRSSVYGSSGSTTGMNNNLAMNNNRGLNNNRARGQGNNNGRGRQPMSQAQSDSRMNQALRTTQGVQMQLSQHGSSNSTSHARARGHLQVAMQELGHALSIR